MKQAAFALMLAVMFAVISGYAEGPGAQAVEDALSLDEAIAASSADIRGKLPPGTRVAVVAFESPHPNLSDYIMRELAGALADGGLEVADRNNLPFVYKELDYQMSGFLSDGNAIGIGKFLGARYVITGELTDMGRRCRYLLNGIDVAGAVRESSISLAVRGDRDFQDIVAALRDSAPLVPGHEGEPVSAGNFLDLGIARASRGEYDKAVADFSRAIGLEPGMRAAWMLRGRALVAGASRVSGAGENLDGFATMFFIDGTVSADKKAVYDKAIEDFTRAIALDPDDKKAWGERGRAYAHKEDYDTAIADYCQAIKLDPEYAAAYNARGGAYHLKKDHERAIADYDQAIRLNPEYADAYNARGVVRYATGDYDNAIADYGQAIRLNPEDTMAYSNRGGAYVATGDYDNAIADCGQAIRLDPQNVLAYGNRGGAHFAKGDYDAAIADCGQAIRLDPQNAAAYRNRGRAYFAKEDYDTAIADFGQAVKLDPQNAASYYDLGVVYYYKGDYARARADWEQALRMDPGNGYVRHGLEILRQAGY
jgi:tetratricopeptide (TPR) repeat protein